MKFFILAALIGLSTALCGHDDCQSCAGDSSCFWDLGSNSCKSVLIQAFTTKGNVIPQALSCPTPLPAFEYTDDFGRNTAFVFAMASNSDGLENANSCVQDKYPNAYAIKQYTVNCDFLGSPCSAVLFNHSDAKAFVLAFRGSKGTNQFTIEALNLLFAVSKKSPLYDGKVFNYFSDALSGFWAAGLGDDLQTFKAQNPDYELWVFGHSLGASLATLGANAAVRQGIFSSDKVKVVNMGEPRTGDYDFAAEVSRNVPQAYRIVIKKDIVTKMALKLALEQTNAYHTNFEVWYNNDMSIGSSFTINNRADDASGSNVDVLGNLDDHNLYFNIDMRIYGTDGCH